jgi:hypothetical protein
MYTCKSMSIMYEFYNELHRIAAFTWSDIEETDKIYVRYEDLVRIVVVECWDHLDSFKDNVMMMTFPTADTIYVEDAIHVDKLSEFNILLRKHAYSCTKCRVNINHFDRIYSPKSTIVPAPKTEDPISSGALPRGGIAGAFNFGAAAPPSFPYTTYDCTTGEPSAKRAKIGK